MSPFRPAMTSRRTMIVLMLLSLKSRCLPLLHVPDVVYSHLLVATTAHSLRYLRTLPQPCLIKYLLTSFFVVCQHIGSFARLIYLVLRSQRARQRIRLTKDSDFLVASPTYQLYITFGKSGENRTPIRSFGDSCFTIKLHSYMVDVVRLELTLYGF